MSKTQILARIKQVTKNSSHKDLRNKTLNERLLKHPRHLVPLRSVGGKKHRIDLFVQEATKVQAQVSVVNSLDIVPFKISQILKGQNLPPTVKYAPGLEFLPWNSTLLITESGVATEADQVTVTQAFAGVAETGTLVLLSGPDSPTSLSLLPEVNIVLIDSERIFGTYEDVWDRLREEKGVLKGMDNFLPRSVNLITGPSRTADIEQTLLLGVHGPRSLHILLVKNEP